MDQPSQLQGHTTKGMKIRNPIQIAIDNPRSMRAALNAKCWDCSGQSKVEVGRCVVEDCSLWLFRPWRGRGED